MPTLNGNYIDLIILVVLVLYVLEGIERGFWYLLGDVVTFILSFLLALKFYSAVGSFIVANFNLPFSFGNAIGFILVAMFSQFFLGNLAHMLLKKLPEKWESVWWSRGLAVLPASLNGVIFIAVFLTLLISIPISPQIKKDIVDSKSGAVLVKTTSQLEKQMADIFGEALKDTLTFFTIPVESQERIRIPFRPQTLSVDEATEQQMLVLVNQERQKFGLKILVMDSEIMKVARAHSKDMWEREYFSHINPDGETPFDRMSKAGIKFSRAGENLALAPTVEMAHQGLMNSPGHRRNILDPNFLRVGIGVIDGGIYGKMFTQNFAD